VLEAADGPPSLFLTTMVSPFATGRSLSLLELGSPGSWIGTGGKPPSSSCSSGATPVFSANMCWNSETLRVVSRPADRTAGESE
jgi:hypothetical protein